MTLSRAILIVICSFFASIGFGIGFQISPKRLGFAGLGGAIVRTAFILIGLGIQQKFLLYLLSAMVAGLYVELISYKSKCSATVFLYPAIIPLIPGDMLYYTFNGLVTGNYTYFGVNGLYLLQALIGLSMGFVLISMAMYYRRRYLFKKLNPIINNMDIMDL